ncbi:RidA family protein [Halopelagius longus]|nr:RidA family protein [Halopelagius longus]
MTHTDGSRKRHAATGRFGRRSRDELLGLRTKLDNTDSMQKNVTRHESDRLSALGGYGVRKRGLQLVFFDGQTPDERTALRRGVKEQTIAALDRVTSVAAESDVEADDIMRTTVYLTKMDRLPEVESAYEEFFDGRRPSMTVVGVGALPNDADVQIEATGVDR